MGDLLLKTSDKSSYFIRVAAENQPLDAEAGCASHVVLQIVNKYGLFTVCGEFFTSFAEKLLLGLTNLDISGENHTVKICRRRSILHLSGVI